MPDKVLKPTPEMTALLKRSGAANRQESFDATRELAIALQLPLRQGILAGDTIGGIFESNVLEPGATAEYPLDIIAPGTEKDFVAYTMPNAGYIPWRHVEGDYVTVPTFPIANAIDWNLDYARNARWDVIGRCMQVLKSGFTKKINDDAWHTLIGAGVDRNILVFDGDAAAGQFTKRLVSLMKVVMRRNGGGNSSSVDRGILTDIYISPEGIEDMRDWKVDQVDELTRREIFLADDGSLNRIFNVNLHTIDELGEEQVYQQYFTDTLSGALASGDLELVVGLDLSVNNSFVMPIREELQIFPDDNLHRHQKAGFYGWQRQGYGVLSSRTVLLGSF